MHVGVVVLDSSVGKTEYDDCTCGISKLESRFTCGEAMKVYVGLESRVLGLDAKFPCVEAGFPCAASVACTAEKEGFKMRGLTW